MATFRHSSYGKQPGVTAGARGQAPSSSSSLGFNLPRRSSSLGGTGAMIVSNGRSGEPTKQSERGPCAGIRDLRESAPVADDRADALNDHLSYIGGRTLMMVGTNTGGPVKVTQSFYALYNRLFEYCAGGEHQCNLHAFVHTVEEEEDETLFMVINDPLLMRLAKSEVRKLINSYPSEPELVTFDQLIHRLQIETRLDFSDVHVDSSEEAGRKASVSGMWDDLKANSRELYRRFLAMNSSDFLYGLSTVDGDGEGKEMGRGQKQGLDSLQTLRPATTFASNKGAPGFMDLTNTRKEAKNSIKSRPPSSSMPPTPGSASSVTEVETAAKGTPYLSFSRPGLHVHSSESGQGGMGTVQLAKSPEEEYNQATARVDELMRRRQEEKAAEAAQAKRNRGKERAQVIDLVSDDDGEETTAMDVQEDSEADMRGLSAPPSVPSVDGDAHSARFRKLTKIESTTAEAILRGPQSRELLIYKFNIDITRAKIVCLRPTTWINDEVINFYMSMLKERDDALAEKYPKHRRSHYFNSFFMNKLLLVDGKEEYDYKGVRRWSKKFDTFAMDKVFVPINISNSHWTMLIIYVQRKEIHYNDSMSGSGKRYLLAARQWVIDEGKDKKGLELDPSEWKLVSGNRAVPQQENGFDCGVFSIMSADFASDDLEFRYSQRDMPHFRKKICNDILRGSLDYSV